MAIKGKIPKRNKWESPDGFKELDFKAFIKFVRHHQQEKRPTPSRSSGKASRSARPPRPRPPVHPGWLNIKTKFGCPWLVLVRPEGYGKSSLVEMLCGKRKTVIFCSRSNKQLIEQEDSFRQRWPHLKIIRHISKGQNLTEYVKRQTDQPFKISLLESTSPYAPAAIDESATIADLATIFGSQISSEIFQREYVDYEAQEIDGKEFDVILITISAFQALCTGYRSTWWEHLGLFDIMMTNERREIVRRGIWLRKPSDTDPFDNGEWVDDQHGKDKLYVPDENDDGSRRKCRRNITIIIDDPDKTDFDWMRHVEKDADADELHSKTKTKKAVSIKTKAKTYIFPSQIRHLHDIRERWGAFFEKRQERATLGYGVLRKTGRSRPMVIILTTERITAAYACKTFENIQNQKNARHKRDTINGVVELGISVIERVETTIAHEREIHEWVCSDWCPPTEQAHVTLIYTPLVRKRHHAMLIPIVQELREKFPEEDLTLIANGLGAEWNLSNVRGINSLSERASIIKISALHPNASLSLMAHFKDDAKTMDIVMKLLGDQVNQAIGRNQGSRFKGRPAMVLVDPRYFGLEKLIRYQLTPWSSAVVDRNFILRFHTEEPTQIEKWLKYRLHTARHFATSNVAEHYVESASLVQQEIYWKWREAQR